MRFFNKGTGGIHNLLALLFHMLHLLQCDAVRADYNRTTVYIINRINSSYAFLLKFLHNLGIVYNGPQGMDMPLAVIGTFLCHIYGPLYTETKTCVFSNKYFHKNNRYKTKTSGLGSWVLGLESCVYFFTASTIFFTTSSIFILPVSMCMASSALFNGE